MIPVLRQLANQTADTAETVVGTNLADDGVTALPYQQLLAQLAQQSAENLQPGEADISDADTVPPEPATDSSALAELPQLVMPLPADNNLPSPLTEPAVTLASWSLISQQYTPTATAAEHADTLENKATQTGSIVQLATAASILLPTVAAANTAPTPGSVLSPSVAINTASRLEPVPATSATVLPVLPLADGDSIELPQQPVQQSVNAAATLQQFIRQALSSRQASDTTPVGAVTTNGVTNSSDTVFSWKAELPGQSSSAHNSQWSQKLVHLLADKINLQLGQQIQRAQIRLDPPQLGVIELSVSLDGERTSVQLYAANTQLREAMQQNLDQLRQQLAQRLGNEQMLNIDVRQQSQQQSGQHNSAQQQIVAAHFNEVPDDAAESAAAPGENATNWLNRLV
ncbi:flagellar hook-length control protein FliK [Rheinheimera aquimaris]|uniref:flagellar hook-length control protein FliK n=1 Tax=Rheinheimera aquimaris TaxID=412437 RepID=UPI003A979AF6